MKIVQALILVLSSGLALQARADATATSSDCTQTINGKSYEAIATPAGSDNFSARLLVDGKEVGNLASCFVMERPSTRYVLCSFDLGGGEKFDLYPVSVLITGTIKHMQFIDWAGDVPKAGAFTGCAE